MEVVKTVHVREQPKYSGAMDIVSVGWILFVTLCTHSTCSATLLCNDVVELGSSARMNCVLPGPASVYFSAPNSEDVAYCLLAGECTSVNRNYIISVDVTNTNITRLDIQRVRRSDEGNWTCTDVNTNITSICPLVVTKTPSCEIDSDTDADVITINQELSLTVNVRDYYCSSPVLLLLEVGNTPILLTDSHRVSTTTSDRFTVVFKVTESHLGPVDVLVVCNARKKSVHCGGIGSLPKGAVSTENLPTNLAMIAGITIPIILIIITISLIFCCLRRKRKKRPAGNLLQADVSSKQSQPATDILE